MTRFIVRAVVRAIKCSFRQCGGGVVSGIHDKTIWIGWRCRTCGVVRHYEPTETRVP